tara:strand:- start:3061 stop:3297 length:237 start_codon:yes stop_codon:yes gene_type:complete
MIKEGILVHVPAAVILQKYNIDNGAASSVTEWKTFEAPRALLVSDISGIADHVGVLFQNETWYIKREEVYKIEEEFEK